MDIGQRTCCSQRQISSSGLEASRTIKCSFEIIIYNNNRLNSNSYRIIVKHKVKHALQRASMNNFPDW